MCWGKLVRAASGMRMMKCALTLSVSLLAGPAFAAEDLFSTNYSGDYLCEMKAAGGLVYYAGTKQWVGAQFNDVSQKIVVHIETALTAEPYVFYKVAIRDEKETELNYCKDRLTGSDKVGVILDVLSCQDIAFDYRMNVKTLKFQFYSAGSYTETDKSDVGNPSVVAGECRKVQ